MKLTHNSVEYDFTKHKNLVNELGGIDEIKNKLLNANLFGEQYYFNNILLIDNIFEENMRK